MLMRVGTLFEECAMCLFLCGKQSYIIFAESVCLFFKCKKHMKKKKTLISFVFFHLNTKTKESEKVLCFVKSAVWEIYVPLRKIMVL